MKKILFIIILFSILVSKPPKTYGNITEGIELIRVYDGDTIFVNIKGYPDILGKNIGVRINGIDTPELRTKDKKEKELGYRAKALLESILKDAYKIELHNIQRGKYFRIVADLYVIPKPIDVKGIMISNKLASPYDGGTKDKLWFQFWK